MRPFYQGKLDVFCAVYAVLNALHLLHGLSTWQGKRILAELLVELPVGHPDRWRDIVYNETDHAWLVEHVLTRYGAELFPVQWERPWAGQLYVTPQEVWSRLAGWHEGNTGTGRTHCVLFRFARYLPLRTEPLLSHWTTTDRVLGDTLFLFDASREDSAIHLMERNGFATCRENVCSAKLLVVEPQHVLLLRRA